MVTGLGLASSWFETREAALLTMRDRDGTLPQDCRKTKCAIAASSQTRRRICAGSRL